MPKSGATKTPRATSRPTPLSPRSGNNSKKKTDVCTATTKQGDASIKANKAAATTEAANSTSNATHLLPGDDSHYLVMIRMTDTDDPTIQRLLALPPDIRLDKLNEVLVRAFGWVGGHQHIFRVEGTTPGSITTFVTSVTAESDPGESWKDESKYTLRQVYEGEEFKSGDPHLVWEYDLGDCWVHEFALIGRVPPIGFRQMLVPDEIPVVCLGGEGHRCAEDAGGPPGWKDLKELFSKPRSKDLDDRRGWYKKHCMNGDPEGLSNPWKWDVLEVNDDLQEFMV